IVQEAAISLDFVPLHASSAGSTEFGTVRGVAALDGASLSLDGSGFSTAGAGPTVWPRVRASLDLGDGGRLALTVALDGGPASGLRRAGRPPPPGKGGGRGRRSGRRSTRRPRPRLGDRRGGPAPNPPRAGTPAPRGSWRRPGTGSSRLCLLLVEPGIPARR